MAKPVWQTPEGDLGIIAERQFYNFEFDVDDPDQSTPSVIALMLFFQTLWAPVDKVLSFILTVFSRQCEFGADKFSVDLGMSAKLQRYEGEKHNIDVDLFLQI